MILLWLARAAIGAALLAPLWYWKGGLIEIEATQFIRQYLDGRGVLQKVFDPHANDFGTYQARELSYFVDYLDARAFKLLIGQDVVILMPLSGLVAGLLTALVFLVAIRRYTAVRPLTATLLLLVYFTNYVYVVTAGMLYRSTKPLLAPALMATVFVLVALAERRDRPQRTSADRWSLAAAFTLLCAMGLLDRQGFFYAAAAVVILAANALVWKGRRDLLFVAIAAVVCSTLYDVALAPALVRWINGYSPSFAYQQVPLVELTRHPDRWRQAIELALQANAVLIGSVPSWLGGVLVGALLAWAARKRAWRMVVIVAAVLAAQIAMLAVMIVRHPPVYEWSDHRLWYYPLPFQALLVTGAVIVLERLATSWSRGRVLVLNVLLVGCIVSNMAHWRGYHREMQRSLWFPTVDLQSNLLKASLREARPQASLNPEYFTLYQYCLTLSPPLRARASD